MKKTSTKILCQLEKLLRKTKHRKKFIPPEINTHSILIKGNLRIGFICLENHNADVAELVDATDSKSVFLRSAGSSPVIGTIKAYLFKLDEWSEKLEEYNQRFRSEHILLFSF